jgi:hypothetical protein
MTGKSLPRIRDAKQNRRARTTILKLIDYSFVQFAISKNQSYLLCFSLVSSPNSTHSDEYNKKDNRNNDNSGTNNENNQTTSRARKSTATTRAATGQCQVVLRNGLVEKGFRFCRPCRSLVSWSTSKSFDCVFSSRWSPTWTVCRPSWLTSCE